MPYPDDTGDSDGESEETRTTSVKGTAAGRTEPSVIQRSKYRWILLGRRRRLNNGELLTENEHFVRQARHAMLMANGETNALPQASLTPLT
jgi:hypothetical protein